VIASERSATRRLRVRWLIVGAIVVFSLPGAAVPFMPALVQMAAALFGDGDFIRAFRDANVATAFGATISIGTTLVAACIAKAFHLSRREAIIAWTAIGLASAGILSYWLRPQ
jgi:hypothetical protein